MRKVLLILLGAVLLIGVIAAGFGYWMVFAPNTHDYEGSRGIKLPRGSTFAAVTDSLESAGILRSRTSFELLGKATGWASQVKAGHYTFESGASNYRLLDVIRKGLQTPIRLTIPPGTRPEVIAAVVGREMAFSEEEFLSALTDSAVAAELGTDPTHLFGYMLPDTYFFYWLTDAETVIRKVKEQFDRFYENEIRANADRMGLTKGEVVTLASIVQWETSVPDEKPRVAGVYLNRLEAGMPLQADPTIQYIVLQTEGAKRRLLHKDLQVDHPYNTYAYAGLPPGPITNPLHSDLLAVANAEDHNYWYFVATGNGGHVFSRSYSEHLRAAQRYHELMRERRRELREKASQ